MKGRCELYWFVMLLVLAPGAWASAQGQRQQKDDADGVPAGLKALKNPNPQIRYNAAELLGKLGKTALFAVPHLKQMLKDPSVAVRIKVAESLWKINRTDADLLVPVLVEALQHKEALVRSASLEVLRQLGKYAKDAVPDVKKALQDKVFGVKLQAIRAVAGIGPSAKETIPELIDIVHKDDTGFLEAHVSIALSKIGQRGVPMLVETLNEKDAKLRRVAAHALGLIGPKAYEATPALAKALNDDEILVRAFAAKALGGIGREAAAATPKLEGALKDDAASVRINAALALWQIKKNTAGVPVLADVLQTGDAAYNRHKAALALAEMGADAKSAVPQLVQVLQSEDAELQKNSVLALGRIGPPAAAATKPLTALLSRESLPLRMEAALALWRIEGKLSAELTNVLKNGLNAEAEIDRILTLKVLGEIGPPAKFAVSHLTRLIRDPSNEIRQAAGNALKKIDPDTAAKKGVK